MKRSIMFVILAGILVVICFTSLLSGGNERIDLPSRESMIPAGAVKMTPETDTHPPITVSDEYEQPVPLLYPINTAGAEDSAFIMPDGQTLYLWFTPDTKGDVQAQAVDMVTGIYVAKNVNGQWQPPERVWLSEPGKPVLDGCAFVSDTTMWFCTVREGYTGMHWFTADFVDGTWTNWTPADFDPAYDVGELHIHDDELYFHSPRPGNDDYDLWVSTHTNGAWGAPENLAIVNSECSDGWPWISQDGNELWFTRVEGAPNLYRSRNVDGHWKEPELMMQTLAGEASLDHHGNVYFTHHYYDDNGTMLEADIYVAYRKALQKGVSLSPRSTQADDFLDFFEKAADAGTMVMWAGDWFDLGNTEGGGPRVLTALASTYPYLPLVAVTPQSNGALIRPLNATVKQIYRDSAVAFVEEYAPAYLGVGIEVNSLYVTSPQDFEAFVLLYNEVYDAVKAVSPHTKVFTVFQLERMKGLALWELEADEPHWDVIDRFKTDLVAFTTYPGLYYRNPSDIPDDHYAEIHNHTTKAIAFTEIGWHSAASPQGWESSEQEQAEFIQIFFELTHDVDTELALWSFMYDPDILEPFNSMGLRRRDGTPRPAWDAWIDGGS